MARSESIAKLLPKLIAARLEMTKVTKDAVNPAFKSAYATLASCLEACEPALGKHGLAVLQTTSWEDGKLTLETVLAHDSGEWISSLYPILCDLSQAQKIGAALTYARRYSYLAITGRAPEDDDGETAMGRGNQAAQPAPAPRRESEVSRRNRESREQPRGGPASLQPGYERSTNGPAKLAVTEPPKNGHATNGVAAAAPAAPVAVAETIDLPRVPVSGAGLKRWADEIERRHGPGLLAHMVERGRNVGWPKTWAQLTPEQIEAAYRDAEDSLELIYAAYRDPEPDQDDDGRYDDGGHEHPGY